MKLLNLNTLFIALILSSLCYLSCKGRCKDGYQCIDNECVCPEGRFEAYGTCKALESNEFYATLDDCPCGDTLFFKILDYGETSLRYSHNLKGWGQREASFNLYKLPSGDSIAGNFSNEYCYTKGVQTLPFWSGKFDGPDKIRVTVIYYLDDLLEQPIDSCHFTLHQ